MSQFLTYFNHHAFGFWLCLLILVILVAICLARTVMIQQRLLRRFDAALSEAEGGNVPAMLADYLSTVKRVASQSDQMNSRVDYLYNNLPSLVRHVGLIRFSPFHDTGGDHSFSMAILDGNGDGVVLSGLHSRQESKLYAKPVAGGESRYALTDEERQAITESVSKTKDPA